MLIELIKGVSGVVASPGYQIAPEYSSRTFQASVVGAGATATVAIEVSNTGDNWMPYITLSPAAGTPDGYADVCPWPYVRANPSANTGTLTVTVGC